jgi:hypothetical protein
MAAVPDPLALTIDAAALALSVGLLPQLAVPNWVFAVPLRHDRGDLEPDPDMRDEDAPDNAEARRLLWDFIRRTEVAGANLAPLGSLPVAAGEPCGLLTWVRVSDFVAWADSMGWTLPPAFPRTDVPEIMQRRITAMIDAAIACGYDPLAIPMGGKKAIQQRCLLDPKLFARDTFLKAWSFASSQQGTLRMADRDKYRPKG